MVRQIAKERFSRILGVAREVISVENFGQSEKKDISILIDQVRGNLGKIASEMRCMTFTVATVSAIRHATERTQHVVSRPQPLEEAETAETPKSVVGLVGLVRSEVATLGFSIQLSRKR